MKLGDLETIVLSVLKDNERSRGDNFVLVYEVHKRINPMVENFTYSYISANHGDLGLPTVESITRTRRKLQEKHPEYLPVERVQKWRKEKEQESKEYAREK